MTHHDNESLQLDARAKSDRIWQNFNSGFDKLARVMELVLGLVFIFAVLLNFASVVERNVFKRSILGSDEVQLYIMIWMTFFGAPIVTWRHQHLRMDVLVSGLSRRVRVVILTIELVLSIGLLSLLTRESIDYTMLMRLIDRRSDLAGLPLWIPHSALAVGFGLIVLMSTFRLIELCASRGELQTHASDAGIETV